MKVLLASTSIAVALTGGAVWADGHVSADEAFVSGIETMALRASDLLGARLYITEMEIEETGGLVDEWDDVGEISDVILGNDGVLDAVLADIGGFLGVGEREVAINIDNLIFVSDEAETDEFFIVLQTDRASIENAPLFDNDFPSGRVSRTRAVGNEGSGLTTMASEDVETVIPQTTVDRMGDDLPEGTDTDTAALDNGTVVDNEQTPATAVVVDGEVETTTPEGAAISGTTDEVMLFPTPTVSRDGYETVRADTFATDDLLGAPVYGIAEDRVGEIGDVTLADSGIPDGAIIDVGGFLGLGEKEVRVPFESLTILRSDTDMRVYIEATQDQLEDMPSHEG